MKNNKILIVVGAVVVVGLLIGGFIFVQSKNKTTIQQPQTQNESIAKLNPEDVGLKLILRDDQKAVKFSVSKTSDIKHLSWEFSYDADVPKTADSGDADPNAKVSQGWEGDADIKNTGQPYESQFRELGTCSSGHCRYDTGIQAVNLVLKVTKADGKIYQVNDTLNLSSNQ